MKVLLLFVFMSYAYAGLDAPTASSKTALDDDNTRVVEFARILAYMENQAIYDIVEHFSYLQNRDKDTLTLTKRQRADLLKYIDRYYRIAKAHNLNQPTTIRVNCNPPPD